MRRPYGRGGDDEDAVEMVRHDDERVQVDIRDVVRDGGPTAGDDLAQLVRLEYAVHHVTEDMVTLAGADGDEVGACLGVVVFTEADGAPLDAIRNPGHPAPPVPIALRSNPSFSKPCGPVHGTRM